MACPFNVPASNIVGMDSGCVFEKVLIPLPPTFNGLTFIFSLTQSPPVPCGPSNPL